MLGTAALQKPRDSATEHTCDDFCDAQTPIYVHVKELTDPQTGRRTALEVNYCKFLAFNGSYRLFGWIYIGEVGHAAFASLEGLTSTEHARLFFNHSHHMGTQCIILLT